MSYNHATKTMTFGPADKVAAATASAARKPRASRKATAPDEHVERMHSGFNTLFAEGSPEMQHPWAGIIANLVVSVLGVYSACSVAAYIGIAAAVMTTSAFFGFVITFIAGFILIVQALRAGSVVGSYVATGKFETDYQRAKAWTVNKFGSLTKRAVITA